jgi:hypothetical protein
MGPPYTSMHIENGLKTNITFGPHIVYVHIYIYTYIYTYVLEGNPILLRLLSTLYNIVVCIRFKWKLIIGPINRRARQRLKIVGSFSRPSFEYKGLLLINAIINENKLVQSVTEMIFLISLSQKSVIIKDECVIKFKTISILKY